MNILTTWTNSWIWKAIKDALKENNTIFKISKSQSKEEKFFQCDLCKKEEIEKLDFWSTIFDVVIFNAWVWHYWEFFSQYLENYEEMINLNLLSPMRLLKYLEHNISKNTKIIFIGSIASKKFMKNWSVYLASKFGLRWFAWWLKEEWKKVYIINPKIVDTAFHKGKIDLPENVECKKVEDVVWLVEKIINWEEKRFEIDL